MYSVEELRRMIFSVGHGGGRGFLPAYTARLIGCDRWEKWDGAGARAGESGASWNLSSLSMNWSVFTRQRLPEALCDFWTISPSPRDHGSRSCKSEA